MSNAPGVKAAPAAEPANVADLFVDPEGEARKALARNARSLRKISLWGVIICGVFVFGAGSWAALAPLASAAMAPGVVSPEGYRRTIQHLEGGIIQQILVKDGDHVKAGQPLLILDATRDMANLDIIQIQRFGAAAAFARLEAEIEGADKVTYPDWLLEEAKKNPKAHDIVQSQDRLFELRMQTLKGQKGVLEQRVAQLNEQLIGRQAEATSAQEQLELMRQEMETVSKLVKQGFERRSRLLEMQRVMSQFEAQATSTQSALATIQQQINEAKLQVLNLEAQARDNASSQKAELEKELASLESKLAASQDALQRTEITSPIDGTVVNLKFHTIGGVIPGGQPILDIVPASEKMIIDVRISPMDIDVVHTGEECLVKFTAYKQRGLPRIMGKLIYVSPDAVEDGRGGTFYEGKVEVNETELGKIKPAIVLTPGMPADVSITTGTRTVLRYILDPLINSLQRSFVED
jgi:HlyD family secretion protein